MAIQSYFFNAIESGSTYDRTYTAEDFCNYLEKLVGNGVFINPSTSLQVRAGSGMQVIVGAGQGWINGHKIINTADMQIDIAQSDVVLNRIDRVVFYADHSTREMGIEVKTGTAATIPTAPALTQSTTRYELCLATVYVGKQVTSIANSNITDTRGDTSVCGYVAGLVDQIDASTIFQQYDSAFWTWFNEVKDDLVTATLIRKYAYTYTTTAASESTFNVKSLIPEYAFGLDILEVRINGLTLNTNEYTKDGDSITLATPVTEVGTHIEFTIYKSVDGSNAETVVDLDYELQTELEKTRITDASGSVKLQLTDSTSDLLGSFVGLGVGFHTISALSGVTNMPKSGVGAYLMGQYVATGYGYVYVMCSDGSVYSNIYFNSKWAGWRCLFDAKPSLLWSGTLFPNANVTITPSKKLSECRNGWALTFCGYNTTTSAATDALIQTVYIPKTSYNGSTWNGASTVFTLAYSLNSETGAVLQTAKAFSVFDDKLVSTAYNTASTAKNLVLRSVQEF